jgi:hypothetical protein
MLLFRAWGTNISFSQEREIKRLVENLPSHEEPPSMSTTIQHRKINIVTLLPGETVADQCGPGDIALVQDSDGWWTNFVGDNGEVDSYDIPFDSYSKALWAAKAAAEFSADSE